MALMYSPKLDTQMQCPDFSELAVDGNTYSKKDFSNKKALVFAFICNHCPYVQAIEDRWVKLASEFTDIQFISVCSNDAADYPEDSFENIKANWENKNFNMPYLYDKSQKMAKDFGAVCTPDFFVFKNSEEAFKLFYRGRLDDSWKSESNVNKQELKESLNLLLKDLNPPEEQTSSMGCSIKWKE